MMILCVITLVMGFSFGLVLGTMNSYDIIKKGE